MAAKATHQLTLTTMADYRASNLLYLLGAKIKKGKGVTMTIQNKTMLITYSDSLGKNLKELNENLGKYFGEAVGGVHLLPFFPSTGDRGFAPVDYDEVDAAFGDWDDVNDSLKMNLHSVGNGI